MGLIKAGLGALGGTLADQWKEFFYCDALPPEVLMRKGDGTWLLWEQVILVGIRDPKSADPWA